MDRHHHESPRNRLNERAVDMMVRHWLGERYTSIARDCGVSRSLVSVIIINALRELKKRCFLVEKYAKVKDSEK